jgi:hypothetical protein
VLRVFEQEGILIVPHLLGHRALNLVFPDSSKGLPHSVAAYDKSIYDSFVLNFSKINHQNLGKLKILSKQEFFVKCTSANHRIFLVEHKLKDFV